jgi:hypothetical protein
MTGHWYTNGRYLMNPGVTGAFTWNGNTTNYALYAALVNSGIYHPDVYNDVYLSTTIASAAEPAAATGYLRVPVQMAPISKAQKTNPSSSFILYPAVLNSYLNWTVSAGQTLTAGYIVFYWDLNVKNADGGLAAGQSYYPSGGKNAHDTTSPLIAYAPFSDATPPYNNYWAAPALITYPFDTSFTGNTVVVSSQVQ